MTSFNLTTAFVALLNFLVGGALVAFIRSRAPMGKIRQEREANLLSERASEMDSMRKRIEALETKLTLADEELRVVRHDLANANTSLDLFIALLEANPERAQEIAKRVQTHREESRRSITEEKMTLARIRMSQIGTHEGPQHT